MSIINPLHPAAILITLRKALAYTLTYWLALPPMSSLTVNVAPPAGTIWVMLLINRGTSRDLITGNPISSPLISTTSYHNMQRSPLVELQVDSVSNYLLPTFQELSAQEPLELTVTNGTATAISTSGHVAVAVIPEVERVHYYRLWRGLHNLLYTLGEADPDEMKGQTLKTLIEGGK